MVSRRQLEANRSNAKRSTGPKTGLGKARAARNSLRHGLTSRQIVIGDEDHVSLKSYAEAWKGTSN